MLPMVHSLVIATQSDLLWVADAKALHHIFHASGYNYPKWKQRVALSRLHSGHGLVWADGMSSTRIQS